MSYISKRKVAQHLKTVWTGVGGRIPRRRLVNIGVKKIRKPRFSPSMRKSSGISKIKKIRKPMFRTMKVRKPSYLALPNETPKEFIKSLSPDIFNEDEVKRHRDYLIQKEKLKIRTQNITKKMEDAKKQWDLTDDIAKKRKLTNQYDAWLFAKEKAENEFNQEKVKSDNLAIAKAIERTGFRDEEEKLMHEKKLGELQRKESRITEESNRLIREMQQADSEEKLREARKDMAKLWDEYDLHQERQRKLAKKLNPYGFRVKISPLFGDRGFGKIKFPRMRF